jgi:hypothetical protein
MPFKPSRSKVLSQKKTKKPLPKKRTGLYE